MVERYKREEGVMSGGGRRIAGTFACMRRSGSDGSGYFRKMLAKDRKIAKEEQLNITIEKVICVICHVF